MLADPAVDAVHLVTGLTAHADQVVRALQAGKHVACTVPMALTMGDLARIVAARRAAGTNYMMMETAVYTREFLWARDLAAAGALGRVSYARGTHFQDMTGWPSYWRGLPPMYYATHAVAPILALLGTRATAVRALGGGRLDPAHEGAYGNPFPVQSALIEVAGQDAVVEVTRSLFQLARSYTESFSIYGDRQAIEWPQLEGAGEHPVLFTLGEPAGEGRGPAGHRHPGRGAGPGRPAARADPQVHPRVHPRWRRRQPGARCGIARSSRAAGTAGPTRTWCTSSCPACWRAGPRWWTT